MHENVDSAKVESFLRQVLLAADTICVQTDERGNIGVPFVAIRESIQAGLSWRCLLPLAAFQSEAFAPGHYSFERLRDIAQELGRAGCELRAGFPINPMVSEMIVDSRIVIAVDRSEEPGRIVVNDDIAHVRASLEYFERQWTGSEAWQWSQTTPRAEVATLYAATKLLGFAQIEPEVATISEDTWGRLIKELAERPDELFRLHPRKFEELVAELLHRDGFEVKLTQTTRDGGRDILAYSETMAGRHLFLVECKRWGRQQPVDVSIVRALYGVVMQERATAGLVVTTSQFTREALKFREPVQFQLTLRNYGDLVLWLKKHQLSGSGINRTPNLTAPADRKAPLSGR